MFQKQQSNQANNKPLAEREAEADEGGAEGSGSDEFKPNLELKHTPVSLVNLYREGKPIPHNLYFRLRDLLNHPDFSKERYVAGKLIDANKFYEELKKHAELQKKKYTDKSRHFILNKPLKDHVDIKDFYRRLYLMLQNRGNGITLAISREEFAKMSPGFNEMVYYYGNQILTGAPYIIGGLPHTDFFQWGNLYGVVKYHELVEEKSLKANLMIYFEDMGDRNLQECIKDYQNRQNQLIAKVQQQKIITPTLPELQEINNPRFRFVH